MYLYEKEVGGGGKKKNWKKKKTLLISIPSDSMAIFVWNGLD